MKMSHEVTPAFDSVRWWLLGVTANGLQETVIMALTLSPQPTLRLVLPEKRRHRRALELGGVA